jgi:hypothetical protein
MAAITEVWIVEPLEGKTKAEQSKRLTLWRDQFLAEGASSVTIYEGGYGEFVDTWVFCINHASAEAWGKMQDKYGSEPESFDTVVESWQSVPVLKIRSSGMLHYSDALSKEA